MGKRPAEATQKREDLRAGAVAGKELGAPNRIGRCERSARGRHPPIVAIVQWQRLHVAKRGSESKPSGPSEVAQVIGYARGKFEEAVHHCIGGIIARATSRNDPSAQREWVWRRKDHHRCIRKGYGGERRGAGPSLEEHNLLAWT